MEIVFEKIRELGTLPVISIPAVELADPLGSALCAGGLPAIEVTLRSSSAVEALAALRHAHPEMAIGAGTVLTRGQAEAAKDAGADFLVSPGFSREILEASRALGLPYVPGVTNPTEITTAVREGLTMLKFFPAEIMGGIAALTLYHGPFPDVSFLPTGGMTFDNVGSYLARPFVAACGGSFMAKGEDVKSGSWDRIEANCRRCREIAEEMRT